MKTLLSFCLLFSISSCSMFLPVEKKDYSEGYITGIGTETLSSEKIKHNLTRELSMSGGDYQIKAFPLTRAYVNASHREHSEAKALTKNSSARFKKALEKKYLNRKACIEVEIGIREKEAVSKLENWRIVLIDSNNIAYKLDWLPEPPFTSKMPVSVLSKKSSYHGKENNWSLLGRACATADLELRKGFKVIFRPSFVQWPFDDEIEEMWSFNYVEIVEGKKVMKKKKERKKEGYRGW